MVLLRQFASADLFLAKTVAQPLARWMEDQLGLTCFQLARLFSLVSVCLDALINLWLQRMQGIGFRDDITASFIVGLCAAGAIILRSLQLQQEQSLLSAGSPVNIAFKFGRWLILAYAGFSGACFLGGLGLVLIATVLPSVPAPLPPYAVLRFVADRLGDASFLFALYCLDLRPRRTGRDKKLAFTSAR